MNNPNLGPTVETSVDKRLKDHIREAAGHVALLSVLLAPALAEATALEANALNPEVGILRALRTGQRPNLVWNGAVLLPAGTKIHSQPVNSEKTVVDVVEPKTEMLLQYPRLVEIGKKGAKKGTLWAAVSQASRSTKPNQATNPGQVFWIPLATHGFESLAYKNYDPDHSNGKIPRTISASIDPRNNLHAKGRTDIPPKQLATMMVLPRKKVSGALRTRGLVSSRTKPYFILPVAPVEAAPVNEPAPEPPKAEIVPPPTTETPTPPPAEIVPKTPLTLEQLPGAELLVSEQDKQALRDATVQLLRDGQNWITATLISYVDANGNTKIAAISALHGLTGDTGPIYSPDGDFTAAQLPNPHDFIGDVAHTYTVGRFSDAQNAVPAAHLIGESGQDLLVIGFSNQVQAAALGKPIPLESITLGAPAEPGAEAFTAGYPQDSGFMEEEQAGRFLGQLNLQGWNGEDRPMNFIASLNTDHTKAAYNFGSSGNATVSTARDGSFLVYFSYSVRASGASLDGYLNPYDYPPFWDWVKNNFPNDDLSNKTTANGYTQETKADIYRLLALTS